MPRPIIIDTDPGQDDAVALLVALASPELDVQAITTVAGNVPLPLTERNARIIRELAKRPDVPVYAGCSRPMLHPLVTAEHVHGKTGLDGPALSDPTVPLAAGHAVDHLVAALIAADTPLTICALGPLTNVAMALITAPEIASRIAEIVLMGGAYWEGGNITPVAEFNIYVDPHAADVVFKSGAPITVLPLDVTHKALMSHGWIESVRNLGSPVGVFAAEMLSFYERYDVEKYGSKGGPLHDPMVIAYLLRPDLFTGRDCNVVVEHGSKLTRGQTVVDWWRITDREPNARWIHAVDSDGFYALLHDRLARY